MGLKRRNRVSPNFSMASMTDVIFLLLIFFMITSTVVSPNAIKVLYADESVPYREIVRVLNIANENHFKMVLATRPPENK